MSSRTKYWWLYLLVCEGGRLYAGIARDVEARFALHASGKGARFTRANPPRELLAVQPFETRSAALKAEYALKRLNRRAKLAWARRFSLELTSPHLLEPDEHSARSSVLAPFRKTGPQRASK